MILVLLGSGLVPGGTGLEVSVVEFLNPEQGFGRLVTVGHAFEAAEVLEALRRRSG